MAKKNIIISQQNDDAGINIDNYLSAYWPGKKIKVPKWTK